MIRVRHISASSMVWRSAALKAWFSVARKSGCSFVRRIRRFRCLIRHKYTREAPLLLHCASSRINGSRVASRGYISSNAFMHA